MEVDAWIVGAILIAALLLAFMALLSGLETAVINARISRLSQFANGDSPGAALDLLQGSEVFLTSAHLAKSLCESLVYAAAALIGLYVILSIRGEPVPANLGLLLTHAWMGIVGGAVTAYLLVMLFAEVLPKSLAARKPERLLLRGLTFIRVFTLAFSPVVWVTGRIARALALTAGADPNVNARAAHSEEEIKLLVEGSAEEGVLEEDEKEMIHSIFEFTDTVARQVMVPRIDIFSLETDASAGEVVELVLESGHSRFPVFEGTLDNVQGIIHVKDLLPLLAEGKRRDAIGPLLRPAYFVPEGKKIDELLQDFRTHKTQIAIVVDEYGGTSGLVTVEDVLEEIVGEIEDEYDVEVHPEARTEAEGGALLVDARMTVEDVSTQLGIPIPEGDYDTLGGFVFSLFGRPPEVGESITFEGRKFVTAAVDGLRLQKIRIAPVEAVGVPDAPETG